MSRDLPTPEFRLRPAHLLYLVDLALAAVIFVAAGRAFMDHKGATVLAAKERERAQMEEQAQKAQVQADSALAATVQAVARMREDSVGWVATYLQKRGSLESGFAARQELTLKLQQLSDQVFGFRDRSQEAVQKSEGYQQDVAERKDEIAALATQVKTIDSTLQVTEAERTAAASKLQEAKVTRTYEPVGLFPDRSSLAVSQQIGSDREVTNFELQHVLQSNRELDLGVALGVGLGSGNSAASTKQVGLLLSRQLVHRRLGLDVGAGYSLLSDQEGKNESGAYASAGLRYSPFYKERLHFGAGARAGHGEVMPYIGITVGRR